MTEEPTHRPRLRARRGLHRGRLAAGAALLVIVFLVGIAFGLALHDNPKPGETSTFLRTFQPFRQTAPVTVTTEGP